MPTPRLSPTLPTQPTAAHPVCHSGDPFAAFQEAAASGHVDPDAQGGADQRAKAVQPATAAVAFFVKAANCCGVAAGLAALAAGLRVCEPSTFNSFAAAAQGIKELGTIRGKASVVSKVLPSVVTEVLPRSRVFVLWSLK